MNEREAIEDYTPPEPSVVAVGEHRIRAFVGDASPAIGSTLVVGQVRGRIVSIVGNRRVEASVFDTSTLSVGDPVTCDPRTAHWPRAVRGTTQVNALRFDLERDDVTSTAASSVSPQCGVSVIDELLPIPAKGTLIVLDCGAPDNVFDRILRALGEPLVAASQRAVPAATHRIIGTDLALPVAVSWASELGAQAVLEAPLFALDSLLDEPDLGCVIVRMHVGEGVDAIAESLDIGRSDTQVFLRSDGTVDLSRSHTRLPVTHHLAARIASLPDIRERLQIFGEDDVEPADLQYLRAVEELERGLIET